MSALLTQVLPWLAAAGVAVIVFIGSYLRGKSTGKEEVRQDVATKVNEQAAEAAKVVRDVQDENRKLPAGVANERLHSRWGVRKSTNSGQ